MQLLELVSDTCRINEEQIVHGVPEGAPKEDYKLSTLVVAIVASILPCSLIYDPFLGAGPRGHRNQASTRLRDPYRTWSKRWHVIFPKHPGTGRMKPTPPLVAELKLWEEDSWHTTRQVSAGAGGCMRVGSSSCGLLQHARILKQRSQTALSHEPSVRPTLTKFLRGRASPRQRPLSGCSRLTVPVI